MNPLWIEKELRRFLIEDIGSGDITSEAIFTEEDRIVGTFIAKGEGRLAGLKVARKVFQLLDPQVEMTFLRHDGADLVEGEAFARIKGKARAILAGERVALNLLQRMSGIATETREVVKKVADLPVTIVDTRKTLPGLRLFDKYAVRVGGGRNHRFGLYDAVMIKDNHLAAAGSMTEAVRRVRHSVGHMVKIEVEAEKLSQVEEALSLGVDLILLDNMGLNELREAVSFIGGRIPTEASGGITPANVRAVAETGVDYISLGWLTHSVKSLDLSLELESEK
ncbi:carboxylating nicotinate-nucleotide diphosphorylase [Thermicanus aegyptius]|uniref:carboxylating nicotinate-nucleotide diphosphorylase n=1 Tax=Thermicanus aegyptius TaxID=94009 RepID=UPI00041FC194|nr:carboxylating nicotinate-nucleotide diphosphorylase [Thermicanus aegyptius]